MLQSKYFQKSSHEIHQKLNGCGDLINQLKCARKWIIQVPQKYRAFQALTASVFRIGPIPAAYNISAAFFRVRWAAIRCGKLFNPFGKIIAQAVAKGDIFDYVVYAFRAPKGKIALNKAFFSKLHGKADHISGTDGIHPEPVKLLIPGSDFRQVTYHQIRPHQTDGFILRRYHLFWVIHSGSAALNRAASASVVFMKMIIPNFFTTDGIYVFHC